MVVQAAVVPDPINISMKLNSLFYRNIVLGIIALGVGAHLSVAYAAMIPHISQGLNDEDHVLNDVDHNYITETYLPIWKDEVKIPIALVMVKSLEGLSAKEYARQAFNQWSMWFSNKEDGFLVLAAPSEQTGAIYVGKNLQSIVSNELADLIAEHEMIFNFKKSDPIMYTFIGIRDAVTALVSEIHNRQDVLSQADKASQITHGFLSLLNKILIVLGVVFCYLLFFIWKTDQS